MADLNESASNDGAPEGGGGNEHADPESQSQEERPPISRFELPDPPEIAFKRPSNNTGLLADRPADEYSNARSISEQMRLAGGGAAAVLTFLMSALVGAYFGSLLDIRFASIRPWGTVGLGLLGAAGGFVNMIRLIKIYTEHSDPNRK